MKLTVGPESVGYELVTKSLVYGGQTLTATDIAVAGGVCKIGEASKVNSLDTSLVQNVLSLIQESIEHGIDQVKVRIIAQTHSVHFRINNAKFEDIWINMIAWTLESNNWL